MANDLNKWHGIGRLIKDPELKFTPNNTAVCNFTLAVNSSYGSGSDKKESASFINCIAWSKGGEIINQYCRKGKRLAVEGRLQQRSWEDKEGHKRSVIEVVVDNFNIIDFEDKTSPVKSEVSNQIENAFSGETFAAGAFDDQSVPF